MFRLADRAWNASCHGLPAEGAAAEACGAGAWGEAGAAGFAQACGAIVCDTCEVDGALVANWEAELGATAVCGAELTWGAVVAAWLVGSTVT